MEVAHGPKGVDTNLKNKQKLENRLPKQYQKIPDKNLHILADVKKEIKKTKEFNKF